MNTDEYTLVPTRRGAWSLRSRGYGETLHPGIGPAAEAEALYVRQLGLCERIAGEAGEFVVWDVGLGAAANALSVLRAASGVHGRLRLASFDNTSAPLEFALRHAGQLGFFTGFEAEAAVLLKDKTVAFARGGLSVRWEFRVTDFPSFLETAAADPPHAVLFDPFSPSANPAMWTAPLFARLFRALDPGRSCSLATYSRSTMSRTALLLAGFFVGEGEATGQKEETTVAANTPALVARPLGMRWLERAMRSSAAEPLWEPVYRQAPLTEETRRRLAAHPQFGGLSGQ